MSNNSPATAGRDFLVIGYGNTLRGDDGVGPRVVEAIEKLNLPGVRTLVCQQLSPEYADPVSRAHTVVFVDAAVDAPREVQLRASSNPANRRSSWRTPPTRARCWRWRAMFSATRRRPGG